MKKSLLLLAAGAVALPGLAIADAHGYSQSISGNVRVNHLQSTSADVTTSGTYLGGGDTYLQWNHDVKSDGGASASGFVRFESSGDWRYNLSGSASEGGWTANAKAEWDVDQDGGDSVDYRDQYVEVTNEGGVSIFFGRNAPFDSLKGSVVDYSGSLSGNVGTDPDVVGYGAGAVDDLIDSRFNYISAGYSMADMGLSVKLRLQIDNSSNNANILGYNIDENATGALTDTEDSLVYDISANAISVEYVAGAIDAAVTIGSGSADGNDDREDGDSEHSQSLSLTKLGLNYDAGVAQVHLNYTATSLELDGATDNTDTIDYTGTNIGVSAAAGPGTVVVDLTNTVYDTETDGTALETSGSATELAYLTNLGPASFKFTYGTGSYDDDNADTDKEDDSYLHLRLEYGF